MNTIMGRVQEVLRDLDGDLISLGHKFKKTELAEAVFCYVHGCTREDEIERCEAVLATQLPLKLLMVYPALSSAGTLEYEFSIGSTQQRITSEAFDNFVSKFTTRIEEFSENRLLMYSLVSHAGYEIKADEIRVFYGVKVR